MNKIGIIYFSGTGNTKFIAQTIKEELEKHNINSDLVNIEKDKINLDNYKNQQLVGKATGMRRESYTRITPKAFNRDITGQVISVELKEKNGKHRTAHILKEHRAELTKFIDSLDINKPLFTPKEMPNRLPCHRFRQQYARDLYDEYIADNGLGKKGYKGFDEASVLNLSKNLGHTRDYIVKHYICVKDYLEE